LFFTLDFGGLRCSTTFSSDILYATWRRWVVPRVLTGQDLVCLGVEAAFGAVSARNGWALVEGRRRTFGITEETWSGG
jgi:hypothetical protein